MEKPDFLSLEWFKSKVSFLVKKDKKVELELFEYKTIKLVNNVITIILKTGEVISKQNCSLIDYNKIISLKYKKDVLGYLFPVTTNEQKQEEISNINFKENLLLLEQLSDFTIKNNVVCLVETDRSLPQILVNKFLHIIEKEAFTGYKDINDLQLKLSKNVEYIAHKRFFLWCCLNPKVQVVEQLYQFIEKNSFNITKEGFIVALRNVVTVSENTDLVNAITNNYQKVKAIWKKNTSLYYLDKDYLLTKDITKSFNGKNLKELYKELPLLDSNRYTDHYTETFDIRVGKVVNMPEEECNYTTDECNSQGLHFTANEINYVGCGDQCMLILINPRKIVGIGSQKGRCYEYFPIMTVPREEATTILKEKLFDTLLLDEEYAKQELVDLLANSKKSFVLENMKNTFSIPSVKSADFENIVKSLSLIKNEIKNRVVVVKNKKK